MTWLSTAEGLALYVARASTAMLLNLGSPEILHSEGSNHSLHKFGITNELVVIIMIFNGNLSHMGIKMKDANKVTTMAADALAPRPGISSCSTWLTGGRLNKKDGLTRYGNSHVKDKTS